MANKKATSFNLSEDLKRRFRIAVAERSTDQSAVVRQCIENWLSTSGAQELQVKSEQSKSPTPFPRDSPSGNLKGAQLALYRELVEKLIRIIASGNAEALILLRGGVKTALNELPPDPPVEASPSEQVPKPVPPKTRVSGGKPG